MRRVQKNTVYRHFKGNYYYVMDIAYSATNKDGTNKKMVVYKSLSDGLVYVRDLKEFSSEVDRKKYPDVTQRYRFQRVNVNKALKAILESANIDEEENDGR